MSPRLLARAVQALAFAANEVDQAEPQRFRRIDRFAGEDQPLHGAGSRPPDQPRVPDQPGTMPMRVSGRPTRACSSAIAQVRRGGELEPATEGDPVQDGDHRLA